jgi:hypothetical protein
MAIEKSITLFATLLPGFMRQYYPDYTLARAIEIIKAIPKAWNQYTLEGEAGQWGPGMVAEKCFVARDTVSKYHRAFSMAGIHTVNGITIPYRPRSSSH